MGESSARRRPTHDTNTSRRQVNTHTSTTPPPPTTTLQQIQTHYEVYWIDCIYFDASSCCYGFNGFCKGHGSTLLLRRFDDQAWQKKEIKHGEIMGKNCCWQGIFLSKA